VEEELLARVNYFHLLGHSFPVCSHYNLRVLEGLRQFVRVIAVIWLHELHFRALELCGVFDFAGHELPIDEAYLVESSSVVTKEYKN
jgi:hypothetical protein